MLSSSPVGWALIGGGLLAWAISTALSMRDAKVRATLNGKPYGLPIIKELSKAVALGALGCAVGYFAPAVGHFMPASTLPYSTISAPVWAGGVAIGLGAVGSTAVLYNARKHRMDPEHLSSSDLAPFYDLYLKQSIKDLPLSRLKVALPIPTPQQIVYANNAARTEGEACAIGFLTVDETKGTVTMAAIDDDIQRWATWGMRTDIIDSDWGRPPLETHITATGFSVVSSIGGCEEIEDDHEETKGGYEENGNRKIRGRRDSMQDTHIGVNLSFQAGEYDIPIAVSGVFDGHGGQEFEYETRKRLSCPASEHCEKFFAPALREHLKIFNTDGLSQKGILLAINLTCLRMDQEIRMIDESAARNHSGTTALVVLEIGEKVYIINVGDSKALLVAADGSYQQLNSEHTCESERELAESLGATYRRTAREGSKARIDGLSVGRSLGDAGTNLPSNPTVTVFNKTHFAGGDLVMCCDGVDEQGVTVADVAKKIHYARQDRSAATDIEIGKGVVDMALRSGSGDNVSCMMKKM